METYVFDVRTPQGDTLGSQTLLFYGLTDALAVGVMPNVAREQPASGRSTSGLALGDITLHAQYRLTSRTPGSWVPQSAIALEEVLPTGRYQNLGDHAAEGVGAGAYTTTIAYYAQQYFWLPNGRILRGRVNVTGSLSPRVPLQGVSVYGTPEGFRGHARPGAVVFLDNAWEYSATRRWVLAMDLGYRHAEATRVDGAVDAEGARARFRRTQGPSDAVIVAPAVEYSWTQNLGVIGGVRVIRSARNATNSVTPVVAFNVTF